jgi:hypothetical protein
MAEATREGAFAGVGWWTIERHAAEHPVEGTKFVVCAAIYLPADTHERLRPDLQFGLRLTLFSEWLRATWGKPTTRENTPYRCRRTYAAGPTWPEAFAIAEEIIQNEEHKFLGALHARKPA